MKNTMKNLTFTSEDEKKKIIDKIISYFLDELDEEIGIVAATSLLDFIEQEIAPIIYNQAIDDATNSYQEHLEELAFKFMELKKDVK
jgi:uncharacterized protein (DUF2164 family)